MQPETYREKRRHANRALKDRLRGTLVTRMPPAKNSPGGKTASDPYHTKRHTWSRLGALGPKSPLLAKRRKARKAQCRARRITRQHQ